MEALSNRSAAMEGSLAPNTLMDGVRNRWIDGWMEGEIHGWADGGREK